MRSSIAGGRRDYARPGANRPQFIPVDPICGTPEHYPGIATVALHFFRTSTVPNARGRKRRDLSMGIVMIRCPETRQAVSTGIRVDRDTFHSTPVFFSRTLCPLCRVAHEWFAKDAWVCDSGAADYDPN
jgi:hypothetical protein